MEAIAILETEGGEADAEGTDWRKIARSIVSEQKALATRMRLGLWKPAARADLVTLLGQLSDPFTLLRTELNSVGQADHQEPYWAQNAKHAAYLEASWKEMSQAAENPTASPGVPSPLVKRQRVNGTGIENLETNCVSNGVGAKVNGASLTETIGKEPTKAIKKSRRIIGVPCRNFVNGNCGFGASCGFLHAMVECPYFASNCCVHGDNCSFLHDARPNQPVDETKVLKEECADGQSAVAESRQS